MGRECWGRDLTLGQPLSICILLGRGALQTERAFCWGKVDVEGKSSLYTNLCTLVDKQAWFEVDPKLHKVRAWWDQPSYMFFFGQLIAQGIYSFIARACRRMYTYVWMLSSHLLFPFQANSFRVLYQYVFYVRKTNWSARGDVIRIIQPGLGLISCPPLLSTSYLLLYSIVIIRSLGQWPVHDWIDVVFQTGSKLESTIVCYSVTWHYVQEIN